MNSIEDVVFIVMLTILGWCAGVFSIEVMIIDKLDSKEPMKLMYYSDKVRINKE